jgi:hypothetical protein
VIERNAYGKWSVIDGPVRGPNRRVMWLCRCTCGREKLVYEYNLLSGQSTGCRACSNLGKHGYERATSEFSRRFAHVPPKVRNKLRQAAWAAIDRCTNHDNPRYEDCGGRGIQSLFADNVAFFEYLLTLPGHDDFSLVLDRIDNDGHYEPGNLQFVTPKESAGNRRKKTRS